MADGGAPALPSSRTCPPEWKAFFGCLVTLTRQMEAHRVALDDERARLLAKIEFLKRVHSQRLGIAEDSIQEIRRGTSLKEQALELLEPKEPATRDPSFVELEDNYMDCFRSISTLVDENTELKKKLKEAQNQAELAENNVDHQHRRKDLKADLRKLKQAYKEMVSEKDKEICVIRAERSFVWNQYKALEQEVQEKDREIGRLQKEAVSVKEDMLMIKNELEQLRSLLKSKDAETDQPGTSQKQKNDMKVTNRKSKREGTVSREKLRIPHATPIRTESETTQKRKRGSSTSSHSLPRGSSRLQASQRLFTPRFNFPKLTAPTPPKL